MDPVSNSASIVVGILKRAGITEASALNLAHQIFDAVTGEGGEMIFRGQTDSAKEARALALEQACNLSKSGALGLTDAAAVVKAADVFTDFLIGRRCKTQCG